MLDIPTGVGSISYMNSTTTQFLLMTGGRGFATDHITDDQRLIEYEQNWQSINDIQTEAAGVDGWETLCGKKTNDVLLSDNLTNKVLRGVCPTCLKQYSKATGTKITTVKLTKIEDGVYEYVGNGFRYTIWSKFVKYNGTLWFYNSTDADLTEDELRKIYNNPEMGMAHRISDVRYIISERIDAA